MSKKKMSEKGAFSSLRSDKREAVKLVFGNKMTNAEIGAKVGREERTIRRWKKEPKFQKALFNYSLRKLKDAIPLAVSTLEDLMINAKSEMVRFQIAKMILDMEGAADSPQGKAITKKAQAEAVKAETEAKLAKQQINDHDTASGQVLEALKSMPKKEIIKIARQIASERNANDQS